MAEINELDEPLYTVTVPYNNPLLVAARKRVRIAGGLICLVAAIALAAIAGWGFISAESDGGTTILSIIMAVLGVCMLGGVIWNFTHIKPSERDNNKDVKLDFFADSLKVVRNDQATGKNRSLENCLYRPYGNKQYVAKVYDYENRLEIKIRTGSYNGAPTYSVQTLPKDVLDAAQDSALLGFLQEKMGKDYVRK